MDGFRHKTLNAIVWSSSSQAGQQALSFIIGVILARLLSPREFGLIAMVTVLTGFARVFAHLGLGAALVYKQDVRREHLSSVFWVNLISGFLLMVIFMMGSSLIAGFYGEPLLLPLSIFISTHFLFDSVSIVQKTVITKSLDFRTLFIVQTGSVGVGGLVAIAMAYSGFGVWSLAVQSILTSILRTLLFWRFSDWRPDLTFKWSAIRDVLGFGTSVLGQEALHYWTRSIDNLLIGRFLGTSALGLYARAYSVLMFPLVNVRSVITRVMFPSLSIIQEDRRRVRHVYLRISRVIALVIFPIMLGLFVVVEPFVLTVFGPKWEDMVPILQVFCLLSLIQSINFPAVLYRSQGRPDLQFKVGLFLNANAILGIVVGLRWGVVGVATGYAIASLINSYPAFFFAGRLVGLRYLEQVRNLSGIFACAVAMALLTWALGLMLPVAWPHWAHLAVQVPVGVVVYGGLVHLSRLQAYQDVRQLLAEQWERRKQRTAAVEAT